MYIFFVQKHSKNKRYEKKIAKEKGLESEMYVVVLPHKLFKSLLPKPRPCAHPSTSFPKLASLQINLELVP